MSFRVVAKVLRESDETLARRLILLVLAEAASDDGVAWIDQETIAKKARLSRTHTTERIREMERDGSIEIRKAQRGRRRISVYRIVLPGLDEPDYDRLPFSLDRPFATTSEDPTRSEGDDVGSTPSTTSDLRRISEVSPLMDPLKDPKTSSELALRDAEEVDLSTPPKLTKIRERDLAFDTLAEVAEVDPSGNRAREVGIALNGSTRSGLARGIRELVWAELAAADRAEFASDRERWEAYLADRIRIQADLYRRRLGVRLTPLALAKWWTDLRSPAPEGIALRYGRGLTTRQIADLADSGDLADAVTRLQEGRIFDAD